jgi:hypothetical protein
MRGSAGKVLGAGESHCSDYIAAKDTFEIAFIDHEKMIEALGPDWSERTVPSVPGKQRRRCNAEACPTGAGEKAAEDREQRTVGRFEGRPVRRTGASLGA